MSIFSNIQTNGFLNQLLIQYSVSQPVRVLTINMHPTVNESYQYIQIEEPNTAFT